jgi:hypothetical protein
MAQKSTMLEGGAESFRERAKSYQADKSAKFRGFTLYAGRRISAGHEEAKRKTCLA